ncbi:hypothetical protein BJ085DRAFT_41474 [Dimargaris cristalligena]|uniref:Uncharacterized protein n=1 Tax=Dimargaris cristalligena TaxID=215637 RepID=A0A4P9ZVQ1_9FUNG|nr:hypothetical protein BJ085DRAFT_41474 [Dimargaris cristalligena]|eukprot:RKP37358.1 hypothetical protein BJ085DRAFT_41474 [Dimargaris cristalligena]
MSFTAPGIASRPVEFLDIVYHISILRWFSELGLGSPTDRTYHYLLRAEQRYMAWWNMLKEIKPNPQNILIPPIDVILMWHTHMLQPRRYQEDIYRLTNDFSLLRYSLPLKRINTIYMRKKVFEAVDVKSWTLFTKLPYELDMNDKSSYTAYVDLRISPKPRNVVNCPDCQCRFSLDMISSKIFWDDLASWRGDRSNNSAVRGVTLDPKTGDWDFEKAEEKLERMDALFQELETVPPDTWAVCEWIHITRDFTAAQNLLDVRHRYDQVFDLGIAQIESCYKDMAGPFSVNLWQLALTNFQVIRRILPNFWANSELTKSHVNQYHAYLVTMNEQGEKAASQYDVDVAWLTHMLRPLHYRDYMLMFAQKLVDWDDRAANSEQATCAGVYDEHASQISHDSGYAPSSGNSVTNSDNSSFTATRVPTNGMSASDHKFLTMTRERELEEQSKRLGLPVSSDSPARSISTGTSQLSWGFSKGRRNTPKVGRKASLSDQTVNHDRPGKFTLRSVASNLQEKLGYTSDEVPEPPLPPLTLKYSKWRGVFHLFGHKELDTRPELH